MILATDYYSDEWQAILDCPLDETWNTSLATCTSLDEAQHEELLHSIVERSFNLDSLKQAVKTDFSGSERSEAIHRINAARAKLEETINSILNRGEFRPHRPVTKGAQQEEAILQAIRGQHADPMNLPRARGKDGIKAVIKRQLQKKRPDLFASGAVVDNTWRRLRGSPRRIKYSDE